MEIQEEKNTFKQKEEDPGFLVARGRFYGEPGVRHAQEKDHRSKLSNAIFMSITNHGYANVRAVGTNAIANAVRAITLTTERCKEKGIQLYWECSLDKGNLGPLRDPSHVQDVTAHVFKLQHFSERG